MKYLLFSLVLFSLFLTSCDGCKNDCPNGLDFNLPLQVYGLKDTLHLGDTLRVVLEIPDRLTEVNTGQEYYFMDYDFKLNNYMDRIDSLPVIGNSPSSFDWTIIQGKPSPAPDAYYVFPTYMDGSYHYEVLIVAKRRGLFIYGMNSTAGRGDELQRLNGPCNKRPTNVFPKLTAGTNAHFEFLKLSPEPVYVNLDRDRFDKFAGFCFFVK